MKKLQKIVAYFCLEYPHKSELTKARLTKMVYLSDWFSSLLDGEQLTNIEWVFNHYGPYVDDVVNSTRSALGFKIESTSNAYGAEKSIISYSGAENDIDLSKREKDILNAVIDKTKSMYFNDFIDYVYSTFPIKSNERYSILDLPELARQYKESR